MYDLGRFGVDRGKAGCESGAWRCVVPSNQRQVETARQWLSGLAVVITTIVCLYSFARISISAVVAASAVALVASIIVSWILGRRLRERGRN